MEQHKYIAILSAGGLTNWRLAEACRYSE